MRKTSWKSTSKRTVVRCQGGEGFPVVGGLIYYFLPLQSYLSVWDKAALPQTPQRRSWSLRFKEKLTKMVAIKFYGKLPTPLKKKKRFLSEVGSRHYEPVFLSPSRCCSEFLQHLLVSLLLSSAPHQLLIQEDFCFASGFL